MICPICQATPQPYCPFHNCPVQPIPVYRPSWRLILTGVASWALLVGLAWLIFR